MVNSFDRGQDASRVPWAFMLCIFFSVLFLLDKKRLNVFGTFNKHFKSNFTYRVDQCRYNPFLQVRDWRILEKLMHPFLSAPQIHIALEASIRAWKHPPRVVQEEHHQWHAFKF